MRCLLYTSGLFNGGKKLELGVLQTASTEDITLRVERIAAAAGEELVFETDGGRENEFLLRATDPGEDQGENGGSGDGDNSGNGDGSGGEDGNGGDPVSYTHLGPDRRQCGNGYGRYGKAHEGLCHQRRGRRSDPGGQHRVYKMCIRDSPSLTVNSGTGYNLWWRKRQNHLQQAPSDCFPERHAA